MVPPHSSEESALKPNHFEFLLNHPHVHMLDWDCVRQKLEHIQRGGKQKLLVISDFDFTLTRSENSEGHPCWSTHGVFTNCAHEVHPEVGDKLAALKEEYHPYEICPKLTLEEKIPFMEKWWSQAHDLIIEAKFEKWKIQEFVEKAKILLRVGTEDLIFELEKASVPLVVFSAGIGNIIEIFFDLVLKRKVEAMHIISNMILFNSKDLAVGFSEPLIHTFCKNESVIRKDEKFYKEVSQRGNVILLGDSLGDIHMDVGVEKDGPTLRIGFLNGNVDLLLEKYKEVYDLVIIQDQTMDIPSRIINLIIQS